MTPFFRLLALACVFITSLKIYGFVNNMLYVTNEPQDTKPFVPYIEDPTLLVPVKTYESLYQASSVEKNISMGNTSNVKSDINSFIQNVTQNFTYEDRASSEAANAEQLSASCNYLHHINVRADPIPVNKKDMELDAVEKKYPEVHWGGRYSPPNCTAQHKVAIIVPYRDRQQHLAIFLNHMHPFLMKQQIEYGIFIIEQAGRHEFNRAKLMNVGFVESQKQKAGGWQCFIFHDIDLLPLDQRNLYSCPRQPRHMSASIDKWKFQLAYEDIFGGVSALTLEQFQKVNGFSNRYWGWGGEDDDMVYRLKKMKYHVGRYKMSVARYAMLNHKKSKPNPKRYKLLRQASKTFKKDGLSTLEYVLVEVVHHHLYTHIVANIDEHS